MPSLVVTSHVNPEATVPDLAIQSNRPSLHLWKYVGPEGAPGGFVGAGASISPSSR